jgi:hypothetical protein
MDYAFCPIPILHQEPLIHIFINQNICLKMVLNLSLNYCLAIVKLSRFVREAELSLRQQISRKEWHVLGITEWRAVGGGGWLSGEASHYNTAVPLLILHDPWHVCIPFRIFLGTDANERRFFKFPKQTFFIYIYIYINESSLLLGQNYWHFYMVKRGTK